MNSKTINSPSKTGKTTTQREGTDSFYVSSNVQEEGLEIIREISNTMLHSSSKNFQNFKSGQSQSNQGHRGEMMPADKLRGIERR